MVLTFTASLLNRTEDVPSRHEHARLLGIAPLMLDRVDGTMIKKRQQLTAGESGVQWALAKSKKGYLTISYKLEAMLLNAFINQPPVVVLPSTKDTLQVMNADGEMMSVRKFLTMVGIGTIFSNIATIKNPELKNHIFKTTGL